MPFLSTQRAGGDKLHGCHVWLIAALTYMLAWNISDVIIKEPIVHRSNGLEIQMGTDHSQPASVRSKHGSSEPRSQLWRSNKRTNVAFQTFTVDDAGHLKLFTLSFSLGQVPEISWITSLFILYLIRTAACSRNIMCKTRNFECLNEELKYKICIHINRQRMSMIKLRCIIILKHVAVGLSL